jgi:hypothetical protein
MIQDGNSNFWIVGRTSIKSLWKWFKAVGYSLRERIQLLYSVVNSAVKVSCSIHQLQ